MFEELANIWRHIATSPKHKRRIDQRAETLFDGVKYTLALYN